jgi:transcription antitermination factor NusG
MKYWYALYVNVRHEKKVVAKMLEKGLESYAPVVIKMSQWSDRRKLVEVPLIPGYVFAYLATNEMDKPRYIAGVVDFVKFQGKPAVIRSEEIEGLKYFVENGFQLEELNTEELRVGDRVVYNLSEFKSFTAIIEDLLGENFAILSFEGVARNFKLKAPVRALQKK